MQVVFEVHELAVPDAKDVGVDEVGHLVGTSRAVESPVDQRWEATRSPPTSLLTR